MSPILVSLIVCTHNPRPDFFSRVIEGICKQTLSVSLYELVIVDNLSRPAVKDTDYIDLSWHPNHKIVVEDALGLTNARLRGIEETVGDVIIFCDDDNVLAPDYLESAIRINNDYPFLGAWGGNSEGEFEIPLPTWVNEDILSSIGIRHFEKTHWSNFLNHCCPIGAGIVLRRGVAEAYAKKMVKNPLRELLGRRGNNLMSGEDIDLANTSIDLGMGAGLFPELSLKHLIPAQRLTLDYCIRLTEDITASLIILRHLQGEAIEEKLRIFSYLKQVLKTIRFRLSHSKEESAIYQARLRGKTKGCEMIRQLSSDKNT